MTEQTVHSVEIESQNLAQLRPIHSVWSYIAGYFDGDGSVDVDARAHTLHWVFSFSDNWIEQVRWVKQLLEGEGITVGKARRTGVGAWKIEVAGIESLKKMATQMLNSGGLYKKKGEIRLILDYYSDLITSVEVSEVLNQEVREGIRIGKVRHFAIPYAYLQGLRRWANGSRSGGLLTDEVKRKLLRDHVELGLNGRDWVPSMGSRGQPLGELSEDFAIRNQTDRAT